MKASRHRSWKLFALTAAMLLSAELHILLAGAGFSYALPPDSIKVQSEKRSNVFYVCEPVAFKLSKPAAAYEVRDYYGNLVDQGTLNQGTDIRPNVAAPGWYKLYIYGKRDQGAPWGKVMGGTMFCIFRNTANFPQLPPPDGNPYHDTDDEIMRGVTGMGPQRHYVNDAANPDADIERLKRLIEIDKKMYLPFDPVRKRKLLIAFPNGTANLAGVRKVVETFKNDVEYFEPRNEPNFGSNGSDFANKELKPFYKTVKEVSPTLKVLGPGIVTIGPHSLDWLKGFLKAGGASYLDGFSFHAYNNVNGDPCLAQTSIDGLNKLLAEYNADKLEKWQTEQGYMAAVYGSYQPRMQGRWTLLQMMIYEQNRIPKEHNHLWYDVSRGYWAFPMFWENEDGSLNPAAPLMRVWSEELYGTTFANTFDFGQPGNRMYLGSLFTGPGKSVAAFMSWGSTDGGVELSVNGGSSVHYVTSFGIEYDLPVVNGHVTIPVPELPVYVELAPSQTVKVVPTNWGPNLARQSGVTGKASGTGTHPIYPHITNGIDKLFNGVLENWYYGQKDSDRPWMDNTQSFPAWVELDLPSSQTIDRVLVYSASPWQLDGTLTDYELQAEIKGQWQTLDRVQEPAKTYKVYSPVVRCTVDSFFSDRWVFQHTFEPVQTQKIRLLVHNVTYGGGATKDVADAGGQTGAPNICLREIEIYNASSTQNAAQSDERTVAHIASPVSIYSPASGTVFSAPANIKLSASALDPDENVSKIEFYANDNKLGESKDLQHILAWNDVPEGKYKLTALATYMSGTQATSPPVHITVGVASNDDPVTGTGAGLLGQYFLDGNLTVSQSKKIDPYVDYEFGYAPPFSVRWSGQVEPKYSETYTFYTQSDDGARLWIDGKQLVNDWNIHGLTENSGTIALQKGHRYKINLEYFQQGGGARIKLLWSSPSQQKEAVLTSQIYPPFMVGEPEDGSFFTEPESITVAARNIGSAEALTCVEFFAGDTKIGEADRPPYSIVWNKPSPGRYLLTAKAKGKSGNEVSSDTALITISAAHIAASAKYLRSDKQTQGNWKKSYGADGLLIAGTNPAFPSYASVLPKDHLTYEGANDSQDIRALQRNADSHRTASCWYSQGTVSGSSFTVDIHLLDGKAHSMAVYLLDWDGFGGGRAQTLELLDADSGMVLDKRPVSSFRDGVYVVWNVAGHVLLKVINEKAGSNAVLGGLFFGPAVAAP